ncbi:MAG: hypothetical protein ACO2ZP_09265 [Bacteriovoracaceae bacterium]
MGKHYPSFKDKGYTFKQVKDILNMVKVPDVCEYCGKDNELWAAHEIGAYICEDCAMEVEE